MNAPSHSCPDCGNAPVNHFLSKLEGTLEWFLTPIALLFTGLDRLFTPVITFLGIHLGPTFFRCLTSIHFGTIVTKPDSETTSRAQCIWDEAIARGITMWEFRVFGLPRELFVATHDGKTILFTSLPRPGKTISRSYYWIDNKGIMRKKFAAAGIPVARGGTALRFTKAVALFNQLTKPVIVKPVSGSRSRHTTTHIETVEGLRIAFDKAKQISFGIIIEQELSGMVFRGTVIGGRVIGVLRREPACVTADGIHTLQELIDIENTNPLRQGPVFHHIDTTNPECAGELLRQKLTLHSIPAKDQIVCLSQKASRGLGGGATDVTDETHPDTIAMLEQVAKLLDESVVGIDFIVADIKKSWKDQERAGIIECNSLPFIDLHMFPLVGKVRDTPGALWDIIFPARKTL